MPPVILLLLILCFSKDYRNKNKPLFQVFFLSIGLLSFIYFYGYITSKYSFGRVISQICVLIQILAGYIIATIEKEIKNPKHKLFLTLFFVVFILTNNHLLKETIKILKPKDSAHFQYNQLKFLKNYVAKDNVVLSDSSNFIIPAFAGKIVHSDFLTVSLNSSVDYQKRAHDVADFFNIQTTDSIRLQILNSNSVNFILLKKRSLKNEILNFCTHHTKEIYSDELWYLFKVE